MKIGVETLMKLSMTTYNDITIVIPVRIDSLQRAVSLKRLLLFLKQFVDIDILIIESDTTSKVESMKSVRTIFVEDTAPLFHRTRLVNRAIRQTSRCYIGVWDADVLINAESFEKAIRMLRNGEADVVLPYDGRAINLTDESISDGQVMFGHFSVGGIFMLSRDLYWKSGGENEAIVGWGPEDIERVKRWEILGYRISRLEGALWHYDHPRNVVNYAESYLLKDKNIRELLRICRMFPEQLNEYIIEKHKYHGV